VLQQLLAFWLPGQSSHAHFGHVLRFRAFFAGSHCIKESATHFLPNWAVWTAVAAWFELTNTVSERLTGSDVVEGRGLAMLKGCPWVVE